MFQPQTGYYQDIVAMATTIFEWLLLRHPFVDGDKREALFAIDVFLRLNALQISVSLNPTHVFLTGLLERNQCSFENLEPCVRAAIRKTW